jgi:hypothetical protein
MSDWEIWAPTQAQLVAVAQAVVTNTNVNLTKVNGPDGFIIEGVLNSGCRFCINYYKFKYSPTGNTITDFNGNSAPEMARVAGFFAIMRWRHPLNTDPPQPSQASGVTLVVLPANSWIRFFDAAT